MVTAADLGANQPGVTPAIAKNLVAVQAWLAAAEVALGVPLRLTSGYRSPEHNAAVGGAPDSDHPNGLAGDFVAVGLSKAEVYARLRQAQLPPFDQLIYYALDDHLHVGLGPRLRGQILVEDVEGGVKRYRVLTAALAAQLWGSVPGAPRGGGPGGPGRA